ncbi:hypothetical protein ACTHOQ_06625 [Solibacillus silvestris]
MINNAASLSVIQTTRNYEILMELEKGQYFAAAFNTKKAVSKVISTFSTA